MADALDVSRRVYAAIVRLGAVATLVSPSAVGETSGGVTETPQSVSVTVAGPNGELMTSQAEGATASFTMSSYRLAVVPKPGFRIVLNGRTWLVEAVQPSYLNGTPVAYEVRVSETAGIT